MLRLKRIAHWDQQWARNKKKAVKLSQSEYTLIWDGIQWGVVW